jgi:small subunit ribosomal protein S9
MTEEPNQPADESPEEDEAPAEDAPAEQPEQPETAEEPSAEQTADEPEAEEPEAEQAQGPETTEAEPEAAESEAPAEPEPATSAGEQQKAKDVPPGAELEPIAIEPERELSAEERARLEAEAEERARLEAEEEERDEPLARRGPTVELAADARIQATGKRKSSIARVIVRPGGGQVAVNGRNLDEYFPRQYLRTMVRQPLVTTGYEGTVDVQVRVRGGGITGQAGAVRHGIARALTEIDPDLRSELKRRGLLTRDARIKERRKAGLKKARKRPQFSKR